MSEDDLIVASEDDSFGLGLSAVGSAMSEAKSGVRSEATSGRLLVIRVG